MRRDDLSHGVRQRLVRLPAPHDNHSGYSRHRIYAAPEVLEIVNRPFGSVPLLPSPDAEGRPGAPELEDADDPG